MFVLRGAISTVKMEGRRGGWEGSVVCVGEAERTGEMTKRRFCGTVVDRADQCLSRLVNGHVRCNGPQGSSKCNGTDRI